MPFLPTVEELQDEIEREKLAFQMLREKKKLGGQKKMVQYKTNKN